MKRICKKCGKEYEEDESTVELTPNGITEAEKVMSLISREAQETLEKHVKEFFKAVEGLCIDCTKKIAQSLPRLPNGVKEQILRALMT